jgi:predicted metal-dependent enzyme (double-stranded beta helix superfamily)
MACVLYAMNLTVLHLAAAISATVAIGAAIVAVVVLRRIPATSQVEGQLDIDASDGAIIELDDRRPKMLRENKNTAIERVPQAISSVHADVGAVVERFAARVNAIGSLSQASPALQARLLEEVKAITQRVNASSEAGSASGYDRRVLCENPDHWSLAAIILRPGQQTDPHNHGGWGCAVTVQGLERDRRFVYDASGNLVLSSERDYPPGTGYAFDAEDIHQPVGADPRRVTVALHFLVHDSWRNHTNPDHSTRQRKAENDAQDQESVEVCKITDRMEKIDG